MATKQTTQLCYQVNGGTCRNKVSAKNSYICAAGHPHLDANKGAQNFTPPLADWNSVPKRHQIAMSATDRNVQLDIVKSNVRGVISSMALNRALDQEVIELLLETKYIDVYRNLATNPSIDRETQQTLCASDDLEVKSNLASNKATDPLLLLRLAKENEFQISYLLATNPSINRETAVELAKQDFYLCPTGYLANKSITELCMAENISLIDKYPEAFGGAYLDVLLKRAQQKEEVEEIMPLLLHSYYLYAKGDKHLVPGGSIRYKEAILSLAMGNEEIKYLLDKD